MIKFCRSYKTMTIKIRFFEGFWDSNSASEKFCDKEKLNNEDNVNITEINRALTLIRTFNNVGN